MSENKNDVLLEVKHLKKYFPTQAGVLHAVDDVSFTLKKGETLGIVGESGCGKSTLGRVILGLLQETSGEVWFDGRKITGLKGREWRKLRSDMQIVFQDPMSSLNPRFTVPTSIAEPLKVFHKYKSKRELDEIVRKLMETVGLDERVYYSYPHELDGGRRQRVGIARALATMPKFIVCDEPVSALDVSIQAQVLNLLQDLQKEHNIAYLFVTHDMSVVKHISNEILVMYLGCMVEKCEAKELFSHRLHPYTKGLIDAIPTPDLSAKRRHAVMRSELTSPINPKPGCRFAPRCPYAKTRCFNEQPAFVEELPGHYVACHYCREINQLDGE